MKGDSRSALAVILAATLTAWAALVYAFYFGQFSQYLDAAGGLLWH